VGLYISYIGIKRIGDKETTTLNILTPLAVGTPTLLGVETFKLERNSVKIEVGRPLCKHIRILGSGWNMKYSNIPSSNLVADEM